MEHITRIPIREIDPVLAEKIDAIADKAIVSIPEGFQMILTLDRHDYVIQVVGTCHAGGICVPQTVIHHHSKDCWCGGKSGEHTAIIPKDYNEPDSIWPNLGNSGS